MTALRRRVVIARRRSGATARRRPRMAALCRVATVVLIAAAATLLGLAGTARADGDPGAQELLGQNLFFGAGDGLSVAQQTQLGNLLEASTALGAPVRLAVIGRREDLGGLTRFWGQPQGYARALGAELELEYSGRVLVVMPQGAALFWYHHTLASLPDPAPGATAAQLTAAAGAALVRVEADARVSQARLNTEASSPTLARDAAAGTRASNHGAIAGTAAAVGAAEPTAGSTATSSGQGSTTVPLIAVLAGLVLLATLALVRAGRSASARAPIPRAVRGLGVGAVVILGLVVLAVVVHSGAGAIPNAQALAFNPDVATPTSLGDLTPAPNFALTDESGHRVSLRDYRGKVVILAFTDSECQTVCPLTTQAMIDARDSLGPAAGKVQLLGVDANWHSTSIDDVANYSRLHGLLGQWHFLTGSLGQLTRVWAEYHIAKDINQTSGLIDHAPAVYVIGPDGKLRDSFLTYASYAAIAQFGQVLAQTAASLLPGHPRVRTHLPYTQITGVAPSTPVTLPRVGGPGITLGRGGPRLLLFFDTWDTQSTPLGAQMQALNAYADRARRLGLPPLTAVDEASVEPNPGALPRFLAGLHLDYPVAIDTSGRLADGYGVQGEPWFVLAVPRAHDTLAEPNAQIPWYQEVYTQGWPSLTQLTDYVRTALAPAPLAPHGLLVARDLAGSPPVLAALHAQSGRLLTGAAAALLRRLAALRGRPVVVNVWGSWCGPCQREFPLFATASALYGKRVAFLGADYDEATRGAGAQFLAAHRVSYPSYAVSDGNFPAALLPGGVQGTPTTIFITPRGRILYTRVAEYQSQQELDTDIATYALGG